MRFVMFLTEKDKFDNDFIVDYTKKHYSQEGITREILGLFDNVVDSREDRLYNDEER